jgi:hypothetical protein
VSRIPDGEYRTEAGSSVTVKNGRSAVEFDWFEEGNACIECTVDIPPDWDLDHYILVWSCEECGGGHADLQAA